MARPVTIFTGQWADLKVEDMCKLTHDLGYDGIELAWRGDHFEVDKAASDGSYCKRKRELLSANDLRAFVISTHLVGQAVCDNLRVRARISSHFRASRRPSSKAREVNNI